MKKQMVVVALALAGAVWFKGILAQEAAKPAEGAEVAAAEAAPAEGAEAAAEAEAPKEITALDQWATYIKQGGSAFGTCAAPGSSRPDSPRR